jgi:hypothetical protein
VIAEAVVSPTEVMVTPVNWELDKILAKFAGTRAAATNAAVLSVAAAKLG